MANDKIQYWLDIATEDITVAETLFNGGHWMYVAFMCHQAIEKTLKAYWCAIREDEPPYTHNHQRLADETGLTVQMSIEQKRFISMMLQMNIEARYPSYKSDISRRLTKESCAKIMEDTRELLQWIQEKF